MLGLDQNGVYVFDGHFAIPMAAAVGHVQKAGDLLEAKQLDSSGAVRSYRARFLGLIIRGSLAASHPDFVLDVDSRKGQKRF